MDCVDRRVILWNEAQCDSYFYEDVKAILSGDCPKVNIKQQGPRTVQKTPVIVLSNRLTFLNSDEFNCRLAKYVWCTCPTFKTWANKKPHPSHVSEILMYFYDSTLIDITCMNTCCRR